MRAGADVNAGNNDRDTPLHYAATKGEAACLQIMLSGPQRARLEVRNSSGHTVLRCAVEQGKRECVDMLLEAGAHTRDCFNDIDRAPEWFLTKLKGRAACRDAVRTFYGLLRKRTLFHGTHHVHHDMVVVVARMLWRTRNDRRWVTAAGRAETKTEASHSHSHGHPHSHEQHQSHEHHKCSLQ